MIQYKEKLEWFFEGESKLPIVIRGNSMKHMIMTIAVLQAVGKQSSILGKYVEHGDGKFSKQFPLTLNLQEKTPAKYNNLTRVKTMK